MPVKSGEGNNSRKQRAIRLCYCAYVVGAEKRDCRIGIILWVAALEEREEQGH